MSKKSPSVSDKARDFFQNLFRVRSQSSQDSPDQPTPSGETMIDHKEATDQQINEEEILPISKSRNEAVPAIVESSSPRKESLEEAAKPLIASLNHNSSFRADDILRAKLQNTKSTSVLSKFPPSPLPAAPKEHPAHGVKPPPLPNIRPPAFSPLVSLKHIEPFEHSEKAKFRPRQLSAPPPKSDRASAQTSPPAVVTNLNGTSVKPSSSYTPRSMSYGVYHSPNYIWDSWEQPAFIRAPGCLSLSAGQTTLPLQSRNVFNAPPPILYYDAYTGQYLPSNDPRGFSRYSGSLNRRSKSRKHHHHHPSSERKSVERYGTGRRHQSTSCLSPYDSEEPQSMPEVGYSLPRPPVLAQMSAQTPTMPYKQKLSSRVLQNYRNEDEVYYYPRQAQFPSLPQRERQSQQILVSRGTNDTPPIQPVTTVEVRQEPLMAAHAPSVYGNVNSVTTSPYPEVITPVYVPPSMQVSHAEEKEDLSAQESDRGEPIRYTSDVVRSLNRQAFRMGRNTKEGALSPKDHYLEVISNGTSNQRAKPRVGGMRMNGSTERPNVRDLVQRFSSQGEEAFVGEQDLRNSRSPRPDDVFGQWRGGNMRR